MIRPNELWLVALQLADHQGKWKMFSHGWWVMVALAGETSLSYPPPPWEGLLDLGCTKVPPYHAVVVGGVYPSESLALLIHPFGAPNIEPFDERLLRIAIREMESAAGVLGLAGAARQGIRQ